jgi:hypothetical protein
MLASSTAYQDAILTKTKARKTLPLLICYFNDAIQHYPFATATASTEYDSAHAAEMACNGRVRACSYTATGYTPAQLWTASAGWWGLLEADAGGNLPTDETLTIDYQASITENNFYVIGTDDNYPVDFTLEYSVDGTTWTTFRTVTGNTLPIYAYYNYQGYTFRYLRLTISKISESEGRVKVLQAGALACIVFDEHDIDKLQVIEELQQKTAGNPVGLVSANTCSFRLNNYDGFTSYNESTSIFYKALNRKFKFRPYIGVEQADNSVYYMPLGMFWAEDYQEESGDLVSSFAGVDRLYQLKNQRPPIFAVKENTTIREMFEYLFDGMGLTKSEYHVSLYLTEPITKGFFAGEVGEDFSDETVGELLQVLAEAGNAYVKTDRFGNIVVRSNFSSDETSGTWDQDDYLFKTNNMQSFNAYYDSIKVRYRIPAEDSAESLIWETKGYAIPASGTTIDIEFPDPVSDVTQVKINGAVNTSIDEYQAGAVRAEVTVANSGAEEFIDLQVYGKKLNFFNSSIERNVTGVTTPKNQLKISNWLIQDSETAAVFANSFISYISDPCNLFTLEGRGDPRYEIGDVVTITDTTNRITAVNVQITRQIFTWRTFFDAVIDARKKIERMETVWLLWPFEEATSTPYEEYQVWAGLQPITETKF